MRGRLKTTYIILAAAFISLLFSACSNGIFNFSDETGNLSFSFTVDEYGGDSISYVVFNCSQGDTQIREEVYLSDGSGDLYLSRVDTGSWSMSVTVYLSDDTVAATQDETFELSDGETVIADFSYWSDGTDRYLSSKWETESSSDFESSIAISQMNVLITGYHYLASGSNQSFSTTLITQGTGFDTYMSGLKLTFPDNTSFEYSGGWARNLTGLEIETGDTYLTLTVENYNSRGDYSLTVSDQNDVEASVSDNCYFDMSPDSGAALIDAWAGTLPLPVTNYSKNDSEQAGVYLLYVVNQSDGTAVNEMAAISHAPYVIDDISAAGDLDVLTVAVVVPVDAYLVLATIDESLTQAEVDAVYESGTTNLAPENLPAWLYSNFGDRINFVGISIAEN